MLLGLATVWGGGVFLGWLALDEPLGWHLAAALALIISGVALVQNIPCAASPVPRTAACRSSRPQSSPDCSISAYNPALWTRFA